MYEMAANAPFFVMVGLFLLLPLPESETGSSGVLEDSFIETIGKESENVGRWLRDFLVCKLARESLKCNLFIRQRSLRFHFGYFIFSGLLTLDFGFMLVGQWKNFIFWLREIYTFVLDSCFLGQRGVQIYVLEFLE